MTAKNTRSRSELWWKKKPSRVLAPKSAESEFRRRVQDESELPITYFLGGARSVNISKNIIGV
jgi:hypothetical protein